MPKLWDESIEAHRHQVRDAILDAAEKLVRERGRRSATMAQIASQAGIGRATLYKYFPDLDAILHAWHARQITGHLHLLAQIRDRGGDAGRRLEDVLRTYGLITHQARGHHDMEFVAFLHQDEHVTQARRLLHELVRDLLAGATGAGHVRDDIGPDELADYCLHALNAAADAPSEAAVHRLVEVTLSGLRPA